MTPGQKIKLLCVFLYGGIVGFATLYVYWRAGTGPHAEAVRRIAPNELIAVYDLRPVNHSKIAGHYAKREFAIGEKIEPIDVSDKPALPSAGVLAAVVSMPISPGGPVVAGTPIQLCLDRKPFGKVEAAIASACDGKSCIVTVPLGELPKDLATGPRLSAAVVGGACGP